MAKRFFILFLFLSPVIIQAQNEIVPLENPVYFFLKQQHIKGNLPGYDDLILPLYRIQVENLLKSLEENRTSPNTSTDGSTEFLQKYFPLKSQQNKGVFSGDKIPFYSVLYESEENHFYKYSDTVLNFIFDPRAALKSIKSNNSGRDSVSGVMQYGAKFILNYGDFLAVEMDAWNGNVYNSRSPAREIREVAQSLTFNKTGLNNFDGTSGYAHFGQEHLNIHFGRNRLIWGTGIQHKLILSNNPQIFDYLNLDFKYNKFRYTFLHGWLTEKVTETMPDSLNILKVKQPKYIAVSRLGYNPSGSFKVGISQIVIYGDRPFEAAYMNPFLFWESAQRSMNDIDNSFLSLDMRWILTPGLELSSSLMLDDIHFGNYFIEGLDSRSNRSALQAGLSVTDPLFFKGYTFSFEYTMIRPYTFSHPGYGGTTTYTNNGYNLGAEIEPNSVVLDANLKGFVLPRLLCEIGFRFTEHGANVTDSAGNLIRNFGGDINHSYDYSTPVSTPLLDGELELTRTAYCKIEYFISYNLSFTSLVRFTRFTSDINKSTSTFLFSLSYGFL